MTQFRQIRTDEIPLLDDFLYEAIFIPDGEINFPRVIVSRGSVEQVEITSATIDNGVLTVTFDGHCISILWLYIHFFEKQKNNYF